MERLLAEMFESQASGHTPEPDNITTRLYKLATQSVCCFDFLLVDIGSKRVKFSLRLIN
jgi:hypothetical protein